MNYVIFRKHPITIVFPASVTLVGTAALIASTALAALGDVLWLVLSILCALALVWAFHSLWGWRNWTVTITGRKIVWKRGVFTPEVTRLPFEFSQVDISQNILERVLGAFTLKVSGLPPFEWMANAKEMWQLMASSTAPDQPTLAPEMFPSRVSVSVNQPMIFVVSTPPETGEAAGGTVIDGECFIALEQISPPQTDQTIESSITLSRWHSLASPPCENWLSVILPMGLGILTSAVIIWGVTTLDLTDMPASFLLAVPPLVGAVYPAATRLRREVKDGRLDLHRAQEAVRSGALSLRSHLRRAMWNLMRIVDPYRAFLTFCKDFVLESDWDPASFTRADPQRTKYPEGIAREDGLLFVEVLRLTHIIRQGRNGQSEHLATNITCLDNIKHRIDRRTFKMMVRRLSRQRSPGGG